MAAKLIFPKWATGPTIPNKAGVSDALTAYNAAMGETLAIGNPNPLWGFLLQAVLHGHTITSVSRNPLSLVEMEVNVGTLAFFASPADIERIVAMGGDLEGYPMFLQFPAAGLTSNVPADWPSREYVVDPEADPPTTAIHTIESYFDHPTAEQYPITFDGGATYVVPAQDPWSGGTYLPASAWIDLPASVSLRTVDWYEQQVEALGP